MGFRGAAQGFRGAAPWGFEARRHGVSRGGAKWDGTSRGGAGVSRGSAKWDGTSRGGAGVSRHSNMDTVRATQFAVSGAPRKAILGPNLQSSCLTRLVD